MLHGKLTSSCCVTIQEYGCLIGQYFPAFPANIYLFKVNNGNTRILGEIYSKLTLPTPIPDEEKKQT